MGFFDRFKRQPEPKLIKRTYSGANTGRLFADFAGSPRSADSELQNAIKNLRNRSRELVRNNAYAKRYIELLRTNVVGKRGATLQVKATDDNGTLDQLGNQLIENAFRNWGRLGNCTLDGKLSWVDVQKMVIEGLARDGEVFIIKHRNPSQTDYFGLEFIEPDQVDEKKSERLPNGNEIRMGVELDRYRKPVAYHVLSYHPGDYDYTTKSFSKKSARIPADRVIHVFKPQRAGQTRGEPWMAAAISDLKQLGAFREAAIINARVGASKSGFFTSPAGDGFVADDLDGTIPIMDAQPGTFHQLPAGVDFKAFDPQYPSGEFDSFHKACLKGIASALGVSYISLANDLEATSYSSIRQGALEERDGYADIQAFMVDHFMMPVYSAWLASAMEMGTINLPLRKLEKFLPASEFRCRGWSWIDPVKEMNASVTGLKAGVLSLQDVANNYGKDVEELLSQIQKDKALMDQFGVQYALEPYAATFTPIPPDGFADGTN